jgi:hypothetical protein
MQHAKALILASLLVVGASMSAHADGNISGGVNLGPKTSGNWLFGMPGPDGNAPGASEGARAQASVDIPASRAKAQKQKKRVAR